MKTKSADRKADLGKKPAIKKISKEQAKLLGAGNQPTKGGGVVKSTGTGNSKK